MILRSLKRRFHRLTLGGSPYRFLFEAGPTGEAVAIDCETTGLDRYHDDIISVAAIRIRGNRILTSECFEALARPKAKMRPEAIKIHHLMEADVEAAEPIETIIPRFLDFIGGRPLIGYYIAFDVAMIDKYMRKLTGIELPNPLIEVSELFYERKYKDAPPGTSLDLSFAAILRDLDLPMLGQHDAFNDALMTAMMYLRLRDLAERKVRIPRSRPMGAVQPTLG